MANLGDPRVATYGGATPEQVDALKKQYSSVPTAPRTMAPDPKKEVPLLLGKEFVAKTGQSATFGFGADAVGAILGKNSEHQIRELAKNYDTAHPLAATGIDLATAMAMTVATRGVLGGGKVAASAGKVIKQSALGGAAFGGLTGAGSGGGLSERGRKAAIGAGVGGVFGGGAGYIGTLLRPAAEKLGLASAERGASMKIQEALKKDGKTMAQLESYIKDNPNARLADFSPATADLLGKVSKLTQKTSRSLGDVTRSDREAQFGRLMEEVSQVTPLEKVRSMMLDDLKKLFRKKEDAYKLSKTEGVEVTPELQRILEHPEVAPVAEKALAEFSEGKKLAQLSPDTAGGLKDLIDAPKPHYVGEKLKRIPSAALDDLQKQLGSLAEVEGTGSTRYGTLKAAQRAIKDHQTGTIIDAQQLAARLGGDDGARKTGIIGAQAWGYGYAFGLKSSDIALFHTFNAEEKEYAKLAMRDGLESYLRDKGRMTEGALTKIADAMKDPNLKDVLGFRAAAQIRQVFSKEAARMRVTNAMERGGDRRVVAREGEEAGMAAHIGNVMFSGPLHMAGTAVKLLTGRGMSEKQALSIIKIASQPGGLAKLQKAGADKNILDILENARPVKGALTGRTMAEQETRSTRR